MISRANDAITTHGAGPRAWEQIDRAEGGRVIPSGRDHGLASTSPDARHATFPVTRRKFWLHKFADNKARDRRVNVALREQGWQVIRIWEHDLKFKPSRVVQKILKALAQ